jgi:hypothetical protein
LNFAALRLTGDPVTRIVLRMKRMGLYSVLAVLLLASGLWAETQGTFRGEVVRPPEGERSAGLLYLLGHDGNVRRVIVAQATIVYDPEVPIGERSRPARQALVPGTEVRVTALVDAKSGEWTASRVEVIAHHAAQFEDDYGDGDGPDEVTGPRENSVASSRTI